VGQVLVIPVPIGGGAESVALPAESQPVIAEEAASTKHVVQQGETLASIGRLYNVEWTTIASQNGITDANAIFVGQELVIGGAGAQPAPVEAAPVESAPVETVEIPVASQTTHTVKANEGLGSIARSYGVNWQAIAQANSIADANTIYVGQVLIIPNPTAAPPADYSAPAPTSIVDNGKMILVELNKQTITAYENGVAVRSLLVSTGLPGTPTVTGDYYVYSKLPSQTMYGPGYYLPGVPWVMYFYQAYAIHGTYWHNNFGQPMSHGCVNLPSEDAEWFYNFAPMGTLVRVVY
ncbi:MAG: LysM peptidoglycan-binding domain-containing protein, partial [Anaerolineae bacterium]|nr:LysM peptidoglycan-binding domain-containing protein [Anaerolineae bacterium]